MLKKHLSILLIPMMVIAFAFGNTASASGGATALSPDPGAGSGQTCSYVNSSQASNIYTQGVNYGLTASVLSLAFGYLGWVQASGILGGSGIGAATNLSPFDTAHFRGTGVMICHSGLEVQSGSPNMSFYKNVTYMYF